MGERGAPVLDEECWPNDCGEKGSAGRKEKSVVLGAVEKSERG